MPLSRVNMALGFVYRFTYILWSCLGRGKKLHRILEYMGYVTINKIVTI